MGMHDEAASHWNPIDLLAAIHKARAMNDNLSRQAKHLAKDPLRKDEVGLQI